MLQDPGAARPSSPKNFMKNSTKIISLAAMLGLLFGCSESADEPASTPDTTAEAAATDSDPASGSDADTPTENAAEITADEPAAQAQEPSGERIFKTAQAALEDVTSDETFVFYLHGGVVEGSDGRPTHPERGTYEYQKIIQAMADTGVVVLSEIRPEQTDVEAYAQNITEQVRQLLEAGATPDRVSVIGFSKGGNIGLRVSHLLANDEVGFVIMGACGPWLADTALDLQGRVLSIYESSDDVAGSCSDVVERSQTEPFFHQIETEMGLGHGSFFDVRDSWFSQAMLWCNAPALRQQIVGPERL